MNDPLAQLKDIHTPDAVSAWPPSMALILLCLTLAAFIGAAIFLIWRYQKSKRYQKEAFAKLQRLDDSNQNPKAFVQALGELLRQLAIYHNPENTSLIGDDWLRYLQQFFPENEAYLLAHARYQKTVALSPELQQSLITNSKAFIKKVRHV